AFMRRVVLVAGSLLLLGGGAFAAFRAVSKDYRYYELIKLGDQLLQEELPFQASRTYTSAIGVKPQDALAYLKRAEAERRQGNLEPAMADLEQASALSSDFLTMSMRLADLYDEAGRFEDAALHYQKAIELDPDSATLYYKLGLAQFRAGLEADALEALSRAAALRERFWEAYYLRGAVFLSLGGHDEAESDFLQALELAPEAELARSALIELYLDRGEPDEARPLVEIEIDANPGAAEPYLHLAEIHRAAGRVAEAIEAVGLALEQDPNLPRAYLNLGELWFSEASRRGDPVALEKAVTALSSVVKMDPTNGAAHLALGRAYLAMGDESRGFTELQRASQATPIQAEAHRMLGDLYTARRNFAEAVTAYHVYLKLSGRSPAVLERLGDAYLELGKPEIGAELFLEVASLEPRRVSPMVKAARAHLVAGNPAAAAGVCRQGLLANPDNEALLEVLTLARRSPRRSGEP
ncbi:MAG TPA: tetratricopeptide repeat protein, partial [Vicinamibacteria bacterium]|nr:tetratricopeptide repeat protein [Vicinamibacteria bacterium]